MKIPASEDPAVLAEIEAVSDVLRDALEEGRVEVQTVLGAPRGLAARLMSQVPGVVENVERVTAQEFTPETITALVVTWVKLDAWFSRTAEAGKIPDVVRAMGGGREVVRSWHALVNAIGQLRARLDATGTDVTELLEGCNLPPAGWSCTLLRGHSGPCPTVPQRR